MPDDSTAKIPTKEKKCHNGTDRTILDPSLNCKHEFSLQMVNGDYKLEKTYWSQSKELKGPDEFCLLEYNPHSKAAEVCSSPRKHIW